LTGHEASISIKRQEQKIRVYGRPHPYPLPQEREAVAAARNVGQSGCNRRSFAPLKAYQSGSHTIFPSAGAAGVDS
jgi:hypothetical protein